MHYIKLEMLEYKKSTVETLLYQLLQCLKYIQKVGITKRGKVPRERARRVTVIDHSRGRARGINISKEPQQKGGLKDGLEPLYSGNTLIKNVLFEYMVRVKGLEPPRLAAPEPKSGASTNSATPARLLSRSEQRLQYRVSSKGSNGMRVEN